MAVCEFQKAQQKGFSHWGEGERVEDTVKKMKERGYMAIKFGGMRNDLSFSLRMLLTGIKGMMKLVLIFPRLSQESRMGGSSVDIGVLRVLGLQTLD